MALIDNLLRMFGLSIENRLAPSPDITKVETAVAIGRIDGDAERQKLDHEIAMRGGPRIALNDGALGRHRGSALGKSITDWLH